MKLKKRHFKRLKEIALRLGGRYRKDLDQLIADIESVQRVKTIKEKPLSREMYERPTDFIERIYDQHRQDMENDFIKQGASSSDPNIPFTRGLRDAVEALSDPKIGDVGYFWTTGNDTRYGKIKEISSSGFKGDTYTVYRIENSDGCEYYVHFSKTPPELK